MEQSEPSIGLSPAASPEPGEEQRTLDEGREGAVAQQSGWRGSRMLHACLVLCILATCVSCDQAVKHFAQRSLSSSAPVLLLHGAVRLELTRNRGAFLSLGEELPPGARYLLFVVVVSAVLAGTLVFTLRARSAHPAQLLALSLLTGGGVGNLIDRLAHDGAVVDFVSVGVGPLRTGIFNLADAAITLGFVLLLLPWRHGLFGGEAPEQPAEAAGRG